MGIPRHIVVNAPCRVCRGTGILTQQNYDAGGNPLEPIENVCPSCNGDRIDSAFRLILSAGHFTSSQIYDCIKKSEFDELGDEHKERVKMILSAFSICLDEGHNMRDDLFDAFEQGTNTRQALEELIDDNL